jgi:prepilin-type N-terminal cleavage/methylation domain-containing protein
MLHKHKSKESGFTLVELMVVITLIAIMAAFAIPMWLSWLPDRRLMAASRDLFSNLQIAKLSAIRTQINCVVSFPAGGYTIFLDANGDFIPDVGEQVIRQVSWAEYRDVSVDVNAFNTGGGIDPHIGFRTDGLPIDAGAFGNGSVTLENTKGRKSQILVSKAGNIRIK